MENMRIQRRLCSILFITFLMIPALSLGAKKRKVWQDPIETVSMGMTHMLPSAYVIPHLTLVLGSSVGLGLFDVSEISSNLYLDVQRVFNLSTKFTVFSNEDFAAALFVGYLSQDVRISYLRTNGLADERFDTMTSITPGFVFSYMIIPKLAGHVGFQAAIRNPDIRKSDIAKKTSFVRGHMVYKEFTYGFTKGMALSIGGTYDLTYDYPGVGATFHIGSFQVGGHYFMNVVEGPFQPIISGSYSTEF